MKKRIVIILLAVVWLLLPLTAHAGPAPAGIGDVPDDPEQTTETPVTVPAVPEQPEVQPTDTPSDPVSRIWLAIKTGSSKWQTIDRGLAFLHISGATARCSVSVVTNRRATITASMTLQRLVNGKWQSLDTWSKTVTGTTLSDERSRFIEPGGTYRAFIRIRVESDDLKVYAYPEQQPLLVGDVDRDNRILAKDARLALRISARLEKADAYTTLCADFNGDGYVRAADARSILRRSAGLR